MRWRERINLLSAFNRRLHIPQALARGAVLSSLDSGGMRIDGGKIGIGWCNA